MKKIHLLLLFVFASIIVSAQKKPEGLFINAKAPDFTALDQNGNSIRLKDLTKKGKVVIMFYRGYWCPYCSKQLKGLEDSLQLIRDKGAQLIAITPETIEGIDKTIEKTKSSFPILSDVGLKIMKAYDVNFEVDDRTVGRYKNASIDLLENNGKLNGANLPVPAVYILDKRGVVIYRYFDSDYKKRPSVKELLDNL
jgi:peroxiredoxin